MLGNWIKQTTTTTGTGPLTLAASAGYPAFSDEFVLNQPFYYAIVDATGVPVETGIGKLTASNTLARTNPLQTMVGSTFTNSGATAVNLASGTYTVISPSVMQQGGVSAFPGITAAAALRAVVPYPYVPAANNRVLAADTPMFIMGRIDAGKGISALGVSIAGIAGTGADKVRVGLYAVNPDGSPGSLVCESGDMTINTTGAKSASIVGGKTFIPPGWYYIAFLSTAAANLAAGHVSIMAQTGPLGMTNASVANMGGTSAAIASGWASMPASISVASLIGMSVDYTPIAFLYL